MNVPVGRRCDGRKEIEKRLERQKNTLLGLGMIIVALAITLFCASGGEDGTGALVIGSIGLYILITRD